MRLLKQHLFLFILIVALIVASLPSPNRPAAQTAVTLRVGFLEGAGSAGDRGAQLAVDQINQSGGVNGPDGTRYRFELVYPQGSPTSPDLVPVAIDNLRAQTVVAIIGPTRNDLISIDNIEALARAGVPILSLATLDTLTDIDVTNNIIRVRAAERYYSEALADVLLKDKGLTRLALIQTDVASTEALLLFEQALNDAGLTPALKIQRLDNSTLSQDTAEILQNGPEGVVMWGPPADAAALLQNLRAANYPGVFAYRNALDVFSNGLASPRLANGVIGVASWVFSQPTDASRAFLVDYVSTFNRIPTDTEAAGYDAMWILRRQIELSGPTMPALYEGLQQTPTLYTVQGQLEPQQYGNGDFARHVTVYTLTDDGGPRLLARYANTVRLPDDVLAQDPRIVALLGTPTFTPTITLTPSITPTPTSTPTFTPTPSQVVINVTNPTVNVRSGPSTDYTKIGELGAGDQVPVIGANQDYTWFAILYRGQQAWVAASVVEIFDPGGLLVQLPILGDVSGGGGLPAGGGTTPSAPTGGIDLVIDSVNFLPPAPTPGQAFIVQINVRNQGTAASGPFTVAGTFEPGGIFSSANVANVGAGGVQVVNLDLNLNGTGAFTTNVLVDSGNTVSESNEDNNIFTITYRIDFPLLSEIQNFTMPVNVSIDMAGGTPDIIWTGSTLDSQNNARLGILNNAVYEFVTFNLIDPNVLTQTSLFDSQVQTGTVIGIITAEGRRGVIKVESRSGPALTVSYRVYIN
ncbi:MAG: ABC transporter substrate-binding protein [Anaerolineales bacterium]|nr:ABC transporter substrate-binding protein [Anaerolineales bacterium]